jgi:BlaI family penicillinase repressor
MPDKTPLELGKRERQILETVQRLGEGSVAAIRAQLADPPSYSAVRTMLGLLVDKGWLKHRRDGKRYLYRPAMSRERSQRTALRRLLATFFGGSADVAVAALLDISASQMTEQQWDRLAQIIATAQKEQRRALRVTKEFDGMRNS